MNKTNEKSIKYTLPVFYVIEGTEYHFNIDIFSDKELSREDFEKIKEANEQAVHTILDLEDITNSPTGEIVYICKEHLKAIKGKKVTFYLTKGVEVG